MQKTITALKLQKRNSNRVNLYLDNEFAFGLFMVNAANLKVGQILTQSVIEKLQASDLIESGYQKALKYIAFKPRTQFDVRKKLLESGFEVQIIDLIIEKLIDKEYINDHQYAQNWIENKSITQPRSKKLITWELKNKKVSDEIIEDVVKKMEPDEGLAFKAAEKYARRLSNCEKEVFLRRLSGFLQRRGFSYSIVKPVVIQTWEKLSQH
jgi:regulatory protein